MRGLQQIVELKDGDFEYDICAIHGGSARFCNECGLLTVWRRSTEPASATKEEKKTPEPSQEMGIQLADSGPASDKPEGFVPLADAMEGVVRRARVRAKVDFSACVRIEAFADDIIQRVDMSRGGVRFRSFNKYSKELSVQIAVPFSAEAKNAPAIFVRGRIAHIKELAEEGCGAVAWSF
jgi:hypothetical protein